MSPLQREPEILKTKTFSILHMYGLFPDTISGSGYMALNDYKTMKWEGYK